MQADIRAGANRGQGLGLGEDLGVGTDADFQILRPGTVLDERLLEARYGLGSGLDRRKVAADGLADTRTHLVLPGGVATGLFLDDPLEQADREGDAAGLDGLQGGWAPVARGKRDRAATRHCWREWRRRYR